MKSLAVLAFVSSSIASPHVEEVDDMVQLQLRASTDFAENSASAAGTIENGVAEDITDDCNGWNLGRNGKPEGRKSPDGTCSWVMQKGASTDKGFKLSPGCEYTVTVVLESEPTAGKIKFFMNHNQRFGASAVQLFAGQHKPGLGCDEDGFTPYTQVELRAMSEDRWANPKRCWKKVSQKVKLPWESSGNVGVSFNPSGGKGQWRAGFHGLNINAGECTGDVQQECSTMVGSFVYCLDQWSRSDCFEAICSDVSENTDLCVNAVQKVFFQNFHDSSAEALYYYFKRRQKFPGAWPKIANCVNTAWHYAYGSYSGKAEEDVFDWLDKRTYAHCKEWAKDFMMERDCHKEAAATVTAAVTHECTWWAKDLRSKYRGGTFNISIDDSWLYAVYASSQQRTCENKIDEMLLPLARDYLEKMNECSGARASLLEMPVTISDARALFSGSAEEVLQSQAAQVGAHAMDAVNALEKRAAESDASTLGERAAEDTLEVALSNKPCKLPKQCQRGR